jgi:hypothetical protein
MSAKSRSARFFTLFEIGTIVIVIFLYIAVSRSMKTLAVQKSNLESTTGLPAAQDARWIRYRNDDGNFSILMPLEPKEIYVSEESDDVSHTIQAISGSTSYTVVYQKAKSERMVNEPAFKQYMSGFTRNSTVCEFVREGPPSPAMPSYFGASFREACHSRDQYRSLVGNMYLGKRYTYTILVLFPAATSDPPSVKRFNDSFSLIDASK